MNLKDMLFSYQRCHKMPAGGLFHRTFMGTWCQHSWAAVFVYEKLLTAHANINLVVELGSGFGGLSVFFATMMHARGGNFLTIERDEGKVKHPEIIEKLGGKVITADILAEQTLSEVRHYHLNSKQTLMLVDGGDKPKEMELYAPLMGKEDIIVCHDWGVEVEEKDIPVNWKKYQPWHQQAEEMKTHQLILRRSA